MAKYAAFDAELFVGTAQTEYAVLATDAAAITGAGNGDFVVTHPDVAGSPLTTAVALAIGDAPADCVTKAVAILNAVGALNAVMTFYAVGINLYARVLEAKANDATFNIAYADNTSAGLTDDATSESGVAGVDATEIAAITNIGGPGLSVDTEDVTTHDQATAFEELVATIIRSGEVSLDIVYDPAAATHDAGTGLVYRLEDKIYSYFELNFSENTQWTFWGYVNGFEPGSPVDGALTAAVKVKITAAPTLA